MPSNITWLANDAERRARTSSKTTLGATSWSARITSGSLAMPQESSAASTNTTRYGAADFAHCVAASSPLRHSTRWKIVIGSSPTALGAGSPALLL